MFESVAVSIAWVFLVHGLSGPLQYYRARLQAAVTDLYSQNGGLNIIGKITLSQTRNQFYESSENVSKEAYLKKLI